MELHLFPPSGRSLGVLALANHLAIDCELVPVDLGRGDQRASAYAALNPNRKVPTLEDDGFVLWEANAILCYLASKRPERGLWPADARGQADVVRWLAWESAHWDAESCGMVTFEKNSKVVLGLGPPDPAFVARGEANFARFAAVLDDHLKGKSWILGERLTIADFSIGTLVPTAVRCELPIERFREIGRWYAALSALPAWRDALAYREAAAKAWFAARQPAQRATSADGVAIHFVAEGKGPAVVLLHCVGGNLHYWDVAAADLARDHRVVRLDLAGHGGSGTDRKAWTVEAFGDDVRAVVDAAGVDRFTIVGHSISGTIALETARRLGDRVAGVVPVDSLVDVDAHMSPETRAALLAEMRADYVGVAERELPKLMPQNPDPQVLARVRADVTKEDPARSTAILDAIWAYREDLALDDLAMPIVAVGSDLRPVAVERNRAHAPQFDARVLADTGHFLMLDRPAEFAGALRAVVESIEAGTARRRARS
jgi:glutathione S-transferase